MDKKIVISETDLTRITEHAIVNFRELRCPVTMDDSQFRSMCFTKAALLLLGSKGIALDVEFPVERVTFSVFED